MNYPMQRDWLFCGCLLGVALALAAWLYWPGASGPTMLDDRSSLEVLKEAEPGVRSLVEQIFADKSGPLGRPVAMASFVMEQLVVGPTGTWSSKATNIILHLINGALLFWLCCLLLSDAGYHGSKWYALLAATIWLASPLYVSTVLYAVQRMAMLAATFMLLTLISYCYFRSRFVRGELARRRLILVIVFLVLAILSKETGIVVLPVLVLMELMWFESNKENATRERLLRRCACGAVITGVAAITLVFLLYSGSVLSPYAIREWTLLERVLTEGRILWDYVGQHYFPDVNRMGLYHDDIVVSRSLSEPASTFWSLLAWLFVAVAILVGLLSSFGRKLGFCWLFFLMGHSTESTVLPLELYFEHRNYFPGIGLILFPVTVVAELSRRWPPLGAPLLAWGGVAVTLLLFKTSSQVQIWSSNELLILNQVTYHPRSFRANADMASLLASTGALERALEFSAVAHEYSSEPDGDHLLRNYALSCMASRLPNRPWAPGYEALASARPLSSVPTVYTFVQMVQDGRCTHLDTYAIADALAHTYLSAQSKVTASANMYSVLAVLENSLARWGNAYSYAQLFLEGAPGSTRGQLMQLHFTTALGKVDEAAELKALLLEKQAHGELTVAEQENLALYVQ
ncbi:hypothetical protein [Parahaliea aestuarii]|uniref:Glycosyltransferase RgtA/B/C/D-like domain-containing protein n=1 Tax=Parahaliea aestuarii TaxID=1852021 RepID=A0A5C9A4C1_9GAMM|nr:hypothetical protein [Parahaliea aestuarii]TXS94959.1 hypothetical protein FVW59_03395 [Parahaliea aestuarii]